MYRLMFSSNLGSLWPLFLQIFFLFLSFPSGIQNAWIDTVSEVSQASAALLVFFPTLFLFLNLDNLSKQILKVTDSSTY